MEDTIRWFEELYDEYGDAIFRHLYFRLGDRDRAKELTQDVFMRAWQYVSQGKTIEYERAWLYRSAHNAFVNEIRTKKQSQSFDALVEGVGFDIPDETADTSEQANHRELLHYLDQLKESYRQVLIMRYIDNLSIIEIAKLLGESETNISMRIKRALEKLRTLYESSSPHTP